MTRNTDDQGGERLESVLSRIETAGEQAFAEVSEEWAQGRTLYGGLQAAVALRVMRGVVPEDRAPRSLLVSFIGPSAPGRLEIRSAVLREGRSATHVESRIIQDGEVRCAVLGAFGSARASSMALAADPRPAAKSPDELPEWPYLPGLTPTFFQKFEIRQAFGGVPLQGTSERQLGGWVRLRECREHLAEEAIVALLDAWPPPVLPMLTRRAAASALTWSIQFVETDPRASAADWWFFRGRAEASEHGYAQGTAELWDPEGGLAAIGTQTAAIFERRSGELR